MSKPLISIIIPIFNSDKYLDDCIKSILDQTFTRFELILVNDGSTDNSLVLCEKYASIDNRIIVLSKKNEGSTSARKAGLQLASGDFIGFIDSDDWIDCDMYSVMYDEAIELGADLVNCGFIIEEATKSTEVLFDESTSFEYILLNNEACTHSLCVKIIKREILTKIAFPVGINNYEDLFIAFKSYQYAKKTIIVNKPFYHYRIRDNSMCRTVNYKMISDRIFVIDSLIKFTKDENIYPLFTNFFLEKQLFLKNTFWITGQLPHIGKWFHTYRDLNYLYIKKLIPDIISVIKKKVRQIGKKMIKKIKNKFELN